MEVADRKRLIDYLGMGVPRETALDAMGLTEAQLAQIEADDTAFAQEIKQTEAKVASAALGLVKKAAEKGNWAAAAWWIDRADQRATASGPNLTAARETLEAMSRDGRSPVDQALVVAFLSLAKAVDSRPGNANLWRQYLDAAKALRAVNDEKEGDDELSGLLGDLFTPVGDTTQPKKGNARVASRQHGRATGPASNAVAAPGGRRRNGATPKRAPRVSPDRGDRPKAKRKDATPPVD